MNTRFTLNCLSLAISSLLLLPAVNSHAGETTRVSVDSAGEPVSSSPTPNLAISADGRFVVFISDAPALVPGDTNGYPDVFVHDRSTGATTRVNVNSTGDQANGDSVDAEISADGRFVTFESSASNLVAGDTNGYPDVFVHDRSTGTTTRVNVNSAGGQANYFTEGSAISADGRFVAFASDASNLVAGDTNEQPDVFVHDRTTGTTTRISIDPAVLPAISADGRFVAFNSGDSNLVPGDTNGVADVLIHDRATGTTTRISVDSAGQQANDESDGAIISADGRFVAFWSYASNLVPGDTNGLEDVFIHDRAAGTTTRISVDSSGAEGNNSSFSPAISADGRLVAFHSRSSNLVSGDTNENWDIFVHDRATGTTTRSSVNSQGNQGGLGGFYTGGPAVSADGRFVAFATSTSNLVSGDTGDSSDVFVRDRQLNTAKTADLQLAVTSQPASVQKGQTASYAYTLTNNGPDSIDTEVKLTDVISQGRVISLTPSQGGCSKAAVSVCRFGSLATGASVTLTAVIKANSNPLTQQLSVNAPPVDNVPDNNSVTVSTPVTP